MNWRRCLGRFKTKLLKNLSLTFPTECDICRVRGSGGMALKHRCQETLPTSIKKPLPPCDTQEENKETKMKILLQLAAEFFPLGTAAVVLEACALAPPSATVSIGPACGCSRAAE